MKRGFWAHTSSGHGVAAAGGAAAAACALILGACGAASNAAVVQSEQKINELEGSFLGALVDHAAFGRGITAIGDLDGDGVPDLAVGAFKDADGGRDRGAVYILFMNADGSVRSQQKISSTEGGFAGPLRDGDRFGTSVASLGDLDGDGVIDLLVGAVFDNDGGKARGAVWVLFLNRDGTVKGHRKVSTLHGGFTGALEDESAFGVSVGALGDVDGDGVPDAVVGARRDADGGHYRGAAWVLFLNRDGTVRAHQKISSVAGGFEGMLRDSVEFGQSVAGIGDFDGDGVPDLAVGAFRDSDGARHAGAVWLLFLNRDGTVRAHTKISAAAGGFTGRLRERDLFGSGVALAGDLDGDGVPDLIVGARRTDDGGTDRGAVWLLFMNADGTVKDHRRISQTAGGFRGRLHDDDQFGYTVAAAGDLNGNGVPELAAGAIFDDGPGKNRGAVWILFLNPAALRP
jgi:hypothetical protein